MAARGRPRIGERIAFRLPEPLLAALDDRAAAAGLTRAEVLRSIVEQSLRASDDGVDLAQIDARLALTPSERVRRMALDARRLSAIRGRARS
jgi:predicted DNA-binding protein